MQFCEFAIQHHVPLDRQESSSCKNAVVGILANQAARAFYHGIAHSDNKVTIDGMLSLDKLSRCDPAWCAAIRDGMDWMVVSHHVVHAFPGYVGVAHAAGNAAEQIASAEGELQLARKVNQAITKFMAQGGKDHSQSLTQTCPVPSCGLSHHRQAFCLGFSPSYFGTKGETLKRHVLSDDI